MKVPVFIDIQREVDVEVSAEDIANAIHEAPDSVEAVKHGLNKAAHFVNAVPPELIGQLPPSARRLISSWFTSQAARFAPPATTEG